MPYIIEELLVEGFRGFSNPARLRFARGLNVVSGSNGSGKSSVLSAVAWAIAGSAASGPLVGPFDLIEGCTWMHRNAGSFASRVVLSLVDPACGSTLVVDRSSERGWSKLTKDGERIPGFPLDALGLTVPSLGETVLMSEETLRTHRSARMRSRRRQTLVCLERVLDLERAIEGVEPTGVPAPLHASACPSPQAVRRALMAAYRLSELYEVPLPPLGDVSPDALASTLREWFDSLEARVALVGRHRAIVGIYRRLAQRPNGDRPAHVALADGDRPSAKIRGGGVVCLLSAADQIALALAVFLVDADRAGHRAGFVLVDDPVGGLDADRRRQLAVELTTRSVYRQVIVASADEDFVRVLMEAGGEGVHRIHLRCHPETGGSAVASPLELGDDGS